MLSEHMVFPNNGRGPGPGTPGAAERVGRRGCLVAGVVGGNGGATLRKLHREAGEAVDAVRVDRER